MLQRVNLFVTTIPNDSIVLKSEVRRLVYIYTGVKKYLVQYSLRYTVSTCFVHAKGDGVEILADFPLLVRSGHIIDQAPHVAHYYGSFRNK